MDCGACASAGRMAGNAIAANAGTVSSINPADLIKTLTINSRRVEQQTTTTTTTTTPAATTKETIKMASLLFSSEHL